MPEIDPIPSTATKPSLTVEGLTDAEQLQLQQLAQLNHWLQQGRRQDHVRSIDLLQSQMPERDHLPTKWNLLREVSLYEWQQRALDQWARAGRRGIIKVVTGAGKTVLALAAIQRLQDIVPDLRVAIIVPTVVLMDQWADELLSRSNLPSSTIATLGGNSTIDEFSSNVRILIAVLNSAAAKLPDLVERAGIGHSLFLVVDECHRAGALERRRLFETPRAYSIGLSATPERDDRDDSDLELDEADLRKPSGDEVLFSEIGPVVFEMNYAEAIRESVLAPFVIEHYGLSLSADERHRYEKLSREITDLRRDLETRTRRGIALVKWCRSARGRSDPRARRFISLTQDRKLLLYRAEARIRAVRELIERAFKEGEKPRIIIFHESISDVMIIFDNLRRLGFPVVAEHSEFPDRLRSESIRLFRMGIAQIIVSAKSLIEGFNVPSADIGIIAAASGSVRQRVQTLGRLLRPDPVRKKNARLVVLYAMQTVDEMIYEKADWEMFIGADRNEYYHWPEVGHTEPRMVDAPPRRPPLADEAIEESNLSVGERYPGSYEGTLYSIDTGGNVIDNSGRLLRPSPATRAILLKWLRGGGRFAVTPVRKYILKPERGGSASTIVFLGKSPEPLFERDEKLCEESSGVGSGLEFGAVYPFSVDGAERFSVLQRDSRLIAKKVDGNVRFVLPPKNIADPSDAAQLQLLIDRLRETYRSGRQINKILVTASGDVVYPYNGRYYFVGRAPGNNGFEFE
ncbi:MAG TPA: DEAD/DEAH box helicase [Stellaceae bacterium]|nr:DEAD/DEAH box helicase [Stellaceae bacterium]